jgi:hypothetical protein
MNAAKAESPVSGPGGNGPQATPDLSVENDPSATSWALLFCNANAPSTRAKQYTRTAPVFRHASGELELSILERHHPNST